jgi:hypothetical protein
MDKTFLDAIGERLIHRHFLDALDVPLVITAIRQGPILGTDVCIFRTERTGSVSSVSLSFVLDALASGAWKESPERCEPI